MALAGQICSDTALQFPLTAPSGLFHGDWTCDQGQARPDQPTRRHSDSPHLCSDNPSLAA